MGRNVGLTDAEMDSTAAVPLVETAFQRVGKYRADAPLCGASCLSRCECGTEQFSIPVSDARLEGIDGGDIEPMAFDYTGLGYVQAGAGAPPQS
jgi:hypothetical protein